MACYNSIVVNAPVEKVWDALKDFHNLSWAPNVITDVKAVGDAKSNQIGAKRILNDAFHETLHAIDDEARSFRYSIDDGPDAVSKDNVQGYIGQVEVFPVTADNATFVLWTSTWKDGGAGAKAFCDPVYVALLSDLKATLES